MRDIGRISARIRHAEAAMRAALEREYPLGTRVRFYIMHGQLTPSEGEVIGYSGTEHAYLRVRIDSRTKPGRDVPLINIIR